MKTQQCLPFALMRYMPLSTMILWIFNVAGNNKRYLDLHVKCPILLSDFNQICNISTDFHKTPRHQISRKSFQWEPS